MNSFKSSVFKKLIPAEIIGITFIAILIISDTSREKIDTNAIATSGNVFINKEVDSKDWMDYPLSDVALINTYLPFIQKACNNYYKDTYTVSPSIVWYMTKVKDIKSTEKSDNPTMLITFETSPFLGAHNAIADDEIIYSVDYTGKIKMVSYKQVKTYELPDFLKELMIKKEKL